MGDRVQEPFPDLLADVRLAQLPVEPLHQAVGRPLRRDVRQLGLLIAAELVHHAAAVHVELEGFGCIVEVEIRQLGRAVEQVPARGVQE